ncbi:hypothetical protein VE04_05194 [Pseudogymnoascus sp. 24MN13]|nr:hypothetical protein VE04_05194 [Pseudogymnoascus sp. 24MN13]
MATDAPAADNWSSTAYQNAAAFVPKLATKVVQWLDIQPTDKVLDIGCVMASSPTTSPNPSPPAASRDSSPRASMISTATAAAPANTTYAVLDARSLSSTPSLQTGAFTKVFSNAALHWILRDEASRVDVFRGAHAAHAPGGTLVFEMGGQGNVAEMESTLLAVVARRIGIKRAREVDPWFFPDERWVRNVLGEVGFAVEDVELEYRPTKCEEGAGEVVEALETVVGSAAGGYYLGYVRLRVKARKI